MFLTFKVAVWVAFWWLLILFKHTVGRFPCLISSCYAASFQTFLVWTVMTVVLYFYVFLEALVSFVWLLLHFLVRYNLWSTVISLSFIRLTCKQNLFLRLLQDRFLCDLHTWHFLETWLLLNVEKRNDLLLSCYFITDNLMNRHLWRPTCFFILFWRRALALQSLFFVCLLS